jgi:hypothetical protein
MVALVVALAGMVGSVPVLLAAPSAAIAQPPPVSGCAWANAFSDAGVDGFGADLNAGYWITSFLATRGAGIELSGSFPQARYMSISAYNGLNSAASSGIHDSQIQPATGSNPFTAGVAPNAAGTFQVQILAEAAPANPAPNTLYVGTNNALVFVMYRVYDADDPANPSDPTGGAGLPQEAVTLGYNPPVVTAIRGGCVKSPGGNLQLAPSLGTSMSPAESVLTDLATPHQATPAPPSWSTAAVTHMPNLDASYLSALINESSGDIIVFRAQMPTFPNTNEGVPAWQPGEDVRYWSICEYGEVSLQAAGCVPDYGAVESGGVATFVVSTPNDRPTNATAAGGVNWLPWGDASAGVLVYRQLLVSPSFARSIPLQSATGSPVAEMGPYYPQIAYCTVAEFEAAGATGCLTGATGGSGSGTGSSGGGHTSGSSGKKRAKSLSRARIAAALDPEIAPSGKAGRIGALLAAHGFTFGSYRLPEAGHMHLTWWRGYRNRHGQMLVGSGTVTLGHKLKGKLRVALTESGRKLLAQAAAASLTGVASFKPTGDPTVTITRKFTLKR